MFVFSTIFEHRNLVLIFSGRRTVTGNGVGTFGIHYDQFVEENPHGVYLTPANMPLTQMTINLTFILPTFQPARSFVAKDTYEY